jgi:hypothetical protein
MKATHKNIAAKANFVYNLYLGTDGQASEEINENSNPGRSNYEFQDFSFDYKKINELKALRALKTKG